MKFKKNKLLLLLPFLITISSMTGCAKKGDITLHVLNCEDYIGDSEFKFTDENDVTYTFADVVNGFEQYESKRLGKNVAVVYDTYDTNETMLSSLRTGKSNYDLICCSDYTTQKMMNMGYFQKINKDNIPNYYAYTPDFLQNRLDNITANVNGVEEKVSDYGIGYMWGTVGILYNPAKVGGDKGLDADDVKYDMASWESLWDNKYRGELSIKDSMRDTYSVGIMYAFREQIEKLLTLSGCFEEGNYKLKEDDAIDYYDLALNGENISKSDLAEQNILTEKELESITKDAISYNEGLTMIFNRCDAESVSIVKNALLELKEKVFGFEVDSGKDDIVKGLIGMNIAWSGDAVYSIETGEAESNRYLYYSVPRTGGNIWFDSWSICNGIDEDHVHLSEDFLNFLSNPTVAAANMDTIGYTSFIGGDEVHNLIREWYDPRFYAMYEFDENDEVVTDEDGNYVYAEGMEGSTYEKACFNGVEMSWPEYVEAYNAECESEDDQIEWNIRNLTYMFEGTLSQTGDKGKLPDTNPYLFYTDEIELLEGDYGEIEVGRMFVTQYPDYTDIPKLAIMKDYGDNNVIVLEMWSDVKSNNLPLVGVVIFGIILAAGLFIIVLYAISKHQYTKLRINRRKESAAFKSKSRK